MTEHHKVWIEQCEAAEGIEDDFGTQKATDQQESTMLRCAIHFVLTVAMTLPLYAQKSTVIVSAPEDGLAWLAAQQREDGCWQIKKKGESDKAASHKPTALSLLAFTAAGYTHKEFKYKTVMDKGLKYLIESERADVPKREDVQRGDEMDAHALITIALCESYAMTLDEQLAVPAQQAIDFLVQAQNTDGGWGGQPDKSSTMLDTAWPMLAVTTGRLAELKVPNKTFERVARFLDNVQVEGGAYYGLTKPEKRPDTTSIGLWCRLHLGTKRGDPAIKKGMKYLAQAGPSETDLRFNYFSTLALATSGLDEGVTWNRKLREQVLKRKSRLVISTAERVVGLPLVSTGELKPRQ